MPSWSFGIGIPIAFGLGVMASLGYEWLKSSASKILLRDIKIKPVNWSKNINDEFFFAVELRVGSGSWLTKLFGNRASVEICPIVRFQGDDGTDVHALAYRVDPKVININEIRQSFEIIKDSTVMLAIVKRVQFALYQFGGYGSQMPLSRTYNATIIIRDRNFEVISEHTIGNYIRDGIVVVDETNNYEV